MFRCPASEPESSRWLCFCCGRFISDLFLCCVGHDPFRGIFVQLLMLSSWPLQWQVIGSAVISPSVSYGMWSDVVLYTCRQGFAVVSLEIPSVNNCQWMQKSRSGGPRCPFQCCVPISPFIFKKHLQHHLEAMAPHLGALIDNSP